MSKYMVKIKDSDKRIIVKGNGVEDEGKFYAIGDSRFRKNTIDHIREMEPDYCKTKGPLSRMLDPKCD